MKEKGIRAPLVEENHWSVMSASCTSSSYDVVLCTNTCDCLVKCSNCKVCVHTCMYSCTCVDYAVHFVACKHIHLVRMQVLDDSDEEFSSILTEMYNENHTTTVA